MTDKEQPKRVFIVPYRDKIAFIKKSFLQANGNHS